MELATAAGVIFSQMKNWLPNFILRKMYPIERLEKLIHVDVRARHESVVLNLGQPAVAQIWLQIINLSPFKITLDRAEFNLFCGPKVKLGIKLSRDIKPNEIVYEFLDDPISDSYISHIAANAGGGICILSGNMQFKSDLSAIPKAIYLEGINLKYYNLPIPENA
jgi:hypothetical protein